MTVGGVAGFAFPGEGKGDLVAWDDFALADVDVGLAFEAVELGGLDEEAAFAGEDGEVLEEVGEEIPGPLEAVGFGPVPVVDIGAVRAVFDYPALVAFAVFRHEGFRVGCCCCCSDDENERERDKKVIDFERGKGKEEGNADGGLETGDCVG